MPSWREMAAQALAEPAPSDQPPAGEYGLDAALVAKLRRLRVMPPPAKIERPDNWRAVVADALTIAQEGWAAQALALGWSIGDLYGVGSTDSDDFEGLAVWLRGRRLALLDERLAIASGNPNDHRSIFIRGGMGHGTHPILQPIMLWNFGR